MISNKGVQTDLNDEIGDELIGNKDRMSVNLNEAYSDYFRLRESNVEGRADVFGSLFN